MRQVDSNKPQFPSIAVIGLSKMRDFDRSRKLALFDIQIIVHLLPITVQSINLLVFVNCILRGETVDPLVWYAHRYPPGKVRISLLGQRCVLKTWQKVAVQIFDRGS